MSMEEIRKERAARYAASRQQTDPSDIPLRNRSRSPRKPAVEPGPEPTELRVLSWNIDGLDCEREEEDMLGRTLWVVKEIQSLRPHVVFLQELVEFNCQLITSVLESQYHVFQQQMPSQPYYVAILVHKASTEVVGSAVTIPFPTKMGRAAVAVDIKLKNSPHKIKCITAHLESLRESSSVRIEQLQICRSYISQHSSEVTATILGGDLNIRDAEVPEAWKLRDCWRLAGSPKNEEFTWDLTRNDNAAMPNGSKPRCRFDRMYLLTNGSESVSVSKFALTGLQRVEGLGRFASDHFGIFTIYALTNSGNPS